MENASAMQEAPSAMPGHPGKPGLPEINEAELVGRVVNAPRVKMVGDPGDEVMMTRFTLAVNRTYFDSSGVRQKEVAYVPVVSWRKEAEKCSAAGKGSALRIVGRIKTWDVEGRNYRLEIQVLSVVILELRGLAPGLPSGPQEESLPN